MANNDSSKGTPPYIAWDTFKTFLGVLKQSAVPNRIDPSMMPSTMSGFNKVGVTTALRFFSLIDANNNTKADLKKLVGAYDTGDWSNAIQETLLPGYLDLMGDLDISGATRHQLNEKFSDASAGMRDRFARFYISMLGESDITVSPYLKARQNRARKKNPKATTKKQTTLAQTEGSSRGNSDHTEHDAPPDGMFQMPIPIRNDNGSFIRVPRNITKTEVQIVKSVMAVIEMMAAQGAGEEQQP